MVFRRVAFSLVITPGGEGLMAIWPDYLNPLRLMAWKHAIWPKLLLSTLTCPGEGAIYRYLTRQGKIAGDIHETKSSGLSLNLLIS